MLIVDTTCICSISANCSDGFCQNGGNCSYPDVNCTCPPNWSGHTCDT